MTFAQLFLETLYERGIRQAFGLSGSYLLPFTQALDDFGKIRTVSMQDEKNAGWAAYLSALRQKKTSLCFFTYGVGGRAMLNSAANAEVNRVPVIFLGAEVPLKERARPWRHHHQTHVGEFDDQQKLFEKTFASSRAVSIDRLDAKEFERALRLISRAREESKPVYIGVPSDAWQTEVPLPEKISLERSPARARHGYEDAILLARKILAEAKRPMILSGKTTARFGFEEYVHTLSLAWDAPVVTLFDDHGEYPILSSYAGTYMGKATARGEVVRIVEGSDCIIEIGVSRACDVNFGMKDSRIPDALISVQIDGGTIRLGDTMLFYCPREQMRDFLSCLSDTRGHREPASSFIEWRMEQQEKYLRVRELSSAILAGDGSPILDQFLKRYADISLVSDVGSFMLEGHKISSKASYVSGCYGCMGISAGAIGLELGDDGQQRERPLILVGDGAFNMYSGELVSYRKYGSRAIFVVLNNGAHGMLRESVKSESFFFPQTDYFRLADAYGGKGFLAKTPRDFASALQEAQVHDGFSIIDTRIARDDAPKELRCFVQG